MTHRALLLAGMVLLALSLPPGERASADTPPWTTAVKNNSAAPAKIDYCAGGTNGIAARYGADFENASDVALTSVRLRFDFFDAFGTLLHSEAPDVNGTFTKGARIRNTGTAGEWLTGIRYFPNLLNVAKVQCAIEKTLDANGHVWTNAALPAPAPSPK